MNELLWSPSAGRIASSNIDRFRRAVAESTGLDLPDTKALHEWSIGEPGSFWSALWDDAGVIGHKGHIAFVPGSQMWEARFFPEARLNFAENLLDGRGASPDDSALIYRREDGLT